MTEFDPAVAVAHVREQFPGEVAHLAWGRNWELPAGEHLNGTDAGETASYVTPSFVLDCLLAAAARNGFRQGAALAREGTETEARNG